MYTFYFIRTLKHHQIRSPRNWRAYQFKKSFDSIEEAVKFFERGFSAKRLYLSPDQPDVTKREKWIFVNKLYSIISKREVPKTSG